MTSMIDIKSQRGLLTCENCGSADIDTEPSRGDSVCINCGSVVEDTLIVSEIGFQEDNHGGISTIGTFVNEDGLIQASIGGGRKHGPGDKYSIHSSSSQATLAKARGDLAKLASKLKINSQCVDTAHNFYKLCLFKGLTRGRRHPLLYGALMYLVCRLEGTIHLLLDFSDVLLVSVFELGKLYLKLSAALCINAPITDPALYIPRFAQKLGLGNSTHEVSMTAVRLVSRMKKDWIHCGRRPSGLCGAALLVAARLHNFNRTTRELVNIVRIRETTLKKRLKEFAATPSAALSLTEFFEIDLEEECDPPSFTQSKSRHHQYHAALNVPAPVQKDNILWDSKLPEVTKEIKLVQQEIETELEKSKNNRRRGQVVAAEVDLDINNIDETELACKLINQQSLGLVLSENGCQISATPKPDVKEGTLTTKSTLGILDNVFESAGIVDQGQEIDELAPLKSILDFSQTTRKKSKKQIKNEQFSTNILPGEIKDHSSESPPFDDFKDLEDDQEIESMIMTQEEVEIRTKLFEAEFGEFLQAKLAKAAALEALLNSNLTSGADGESVLGDKKLLASYKRKRLLSDQVSQGHDLTAGTSGFYPSSSVKGNRRGKKLSAKINYEVLRDLDLLNKDNKPSYSFNEQQKPSPSNTKPFNNNDNIQENSSKLFTGETKLQEKPDEDTKEAIVAMLNVTSVTTKLPNDVPSNKKVRFSFDESNDYAVKNTNCINFQPNDAESSLKVPFTVNSTVPATSDLESANNSTQDPLLHPQQQIPLIARLGHVFDNNNIEDEEDGDGDEEMMLSAAQLLAQMRNGENLDHLKEDEDYGIASHDMGYEEEY